jgi:hypothetical protein
MSFARLRNPAVYHRDLRLRKGIAGEVAALRISSAFFCISWVILHSRNGKGMHI